MVLAWGFTGIKASRFTSEAAVGSRKVSGVRHLRGLGAARFSPRRDRSNISGLPSARPFTFTWPPSMASSNRSPSNSGKIENADVLSVWGSQNCSEDSGNNVLFTWGASSSRRRCPGCCSLWRCWERINSRGGCKHTTTEFNLLVVRYLPLIRFKGLDLLLRSTDHSNAFVILNFTTVTNCLELIMVFFMNTLIYMHIRLQRYIVFKVNNGLNDDCYHTVYISLSNQKKPFCFHSFKGHCNLKKKQTTFGWAIWVCVCTTHTPVLAGKAHSRPAALRVEMLFCGPSQGSDGGSHGGGGLFEVGGAIQAGSALGAVPPSLVTEGWI